MKLGMTIPIPRPLSRDSRRRTPHSDYSLEDHGVSTSAGDHSAVSFQVSGLDPGYRTLHMEDPLHVRHPDSFILQRQ